MAIGIPGRARFIHFAASKNIEYTSRGSWYPYVHDGSQTKTWK